ncbi:MAG: c-type cytochrome domain-containing protein [Planctomycetota bacterium]
MKTNTKFQLAILLAGLLLGNSFVHAQAPAETKDYANHVLPILRANCLACHNTQKAEGGLNLESFDKLSKGGDSGVSFVSGKGAESELVKRVRATDESVMPPDKNAVGAKRLTPDEANLIQAWIDAGAPAGVLKPATAAQWKQVPDTVRPMYAMAASPDGQWVATGRANQTIVYRWPSLDGAADVAFLVDPSTQTQLQTQLPVAHLDMVQSVAISPDAARIATGGFRDIKIWKRNTAVAEDGIGALLKGAYAVSIAGNGLSIAKATRTPTLEIVRADKGSVSHGLECPSVVSSMAWSNDGTKLWVVGEDSAAYQFTIEPNETGTAVAIKPTFVGKVEQPLKGLVSNDAQSFVGITPEKKTQWWGLTAGTAEVPAALSKTDRLGDVGDVIGLSRYEEGGVARVLVATGDGNVRVVQGTDGAVLRTVGHGAPIQHVIAAGDSSKFATIGADGLIKAWKAADGAMLWEQKVDALNQRKIDLAELALARHKSKVERATAKVPELEKAKQAEMEAHGKLQTSRTQIMEELGKKQTQNTAMKAKMDVEAKLVTMDKTIATAAQAIEKAATSLAQFQMNLEQEKQKTAQFEQGLMQVQAGAVPLPVVKGTFTADHRSIVTTRNDGSISIIRGDKGLQQTVLAGGAANINSLIATATGFLCQTVDDGRALVWDWGNRWVLERTIGNANESPFSDRITAMDWSQDGQHLIVGSGAPSRFGELKMVRVADGGVAKDWGQVHSDSILVAKLSPDGLTVATGAADKLLRLHRVDADVPPRTLEGHTHHVLGVTWHDDSHWIASASADNTIKIWDVESGSATRTIPGFGKEVTALAFVGRSNQVVSSSADKQIRVHDASNGGQVRVIGGPGEAVYCSVVAGKVPMAFAGGQDGVLWIWQIDNGQVLQQLK